MAEPAIRFAGLGHAYRGDDWVFRGCAGAVVPGSILAILGPNGCGKTTLLKILMGTLAPREGNVAVVGRRAFVPQLFGVAFAYRVLDMVLMGRARHIALFGAPSARDEAAARAALERLGIADLAERAFHELSGGQRQLVIVARAIASEADILILDEPTSALDLHHQQSILAWIARLAHEDGLTVILTTHQPGHALLVADDALLMLGPTTFVRGPASEVLTEDRLRQLYAVEMRRIALDHRGRTIETVVPILDRAED